MADSLPEDLQEFDISEDLKEFELDFDDSELEDISLDDLSFPELEADADFAGLELDEAFAYKQERHNDAARDFTEDLQTEQRIKPAQDMEGEQSAEQGIKPAQDMEGGQSTEQDIKPAQDTESKQSAELETKPLGQQSVDSAEEQPDMAEASVKKEQKMDLNEGNGNMAEENKDVSAGLDDDLFSLLFDESDTDDVTILDSSGQDSNTAGGKAASGEKAGGSQLDSELFDIGDLLGDLSDDDSASANSKGASDISDIFSDTLGVVNDVAGTGNGAIDDTLLMDLPDISQTKEEETVQPEETVKERKPGFFQKLFGNIHDEKSQAAHEKQLAKEAEEEEKRKQKEAAKLDEDGNPVESEKEKKKRENAEKKAALKAAKEEAKRKKKEAKQLAMKEVAEELDVDEGRINPVGAAVVVVFFIAIGLFIILGSTSFSYSASIKQAAGYFNGQKYTKAYNEVRGLDIKKKDQSLYDKIITVMYVNKQLNSYNNYYAIEKYPEALDSLLKGLQRYDKYIDTADKIGVKSDMDYVRSQILAELTDVYDLSEEQAYSIINSGTRDEYVSQVLNKATTLEDSEVVRKGKEAE